VVHEASPVHLPPTQLLLQQSRLAVQVAPRPMQKPTPHTPDELQKVEQQSVDAVHAVPSDLHSFGTLQRFLPSTSRSQCAEQHSLSAAHESLVSLHALAGTLQMPATQLSEQQSVFLVQGWW
jgi:hypothetical protein